MAFGKRLSARHGEVPRFAERFFKVDFEAQVGRELQPIQFCISQGEGNGSFSQMFFCAGRGSPAFGIGERTDF